MPIWDCRRPWEDQKPGRRMVGGYSTTSTKVAVILSAAKDLRLFFPSQPMQPRANRMPSMHEHSYFTYIMASRSHTLYIGVTSDLHKRVFQHKWKEQDGFTAKYNCDRLVWFEGHQEVDRKSVV